ncbi:Retrovirus-related Pol polyprotein, partial [Mucuna pruriens]
MEECLWIQPKIKAVLDWLVPVNVKGVRGFLGLMRYYRKFIQGYGKMELPLTALTKKDGFKWNKEALEAFDKLKALAERSLSKSAYEKEIMALVLAIQHWCPYLLGRSFIVYSDQRSLKFLLQQRITTADQQCWIAKLLGYQFDVKYKLGCDNSAADALSRRDEGVELALINTSPLWADKGSLTNGVVQDPFLCRIIVEIQSGAQPKTEFTYHQGILRYKNRLAIPASSHWIPRLLEEFHGSPHGGHSGLLQPLEVPEVVWEDVSVDFISVYGRKPPTVLQFLPGEIRVEAVARDLANWDEVLWQLKYHLSCAQYDMKMKADLCRKDVQFRGEQVYLKLRLHKQKSVANRINQRLFARFYGPFTIAKKVGSVAYQFDLPPTSRIHPVFHISQLKKSIGQ